MKAAENEIALDVWKRLARFKSFNVQLEKEDFKEIKEEFSRGVTCTYSNPKQDDPSDTNILRVYKSQKGIQVEINEKKATDPNFLSKLASDMTYSFGRLFSQIGGLQEGDPPLQPQP